MSAPIIIETPAPPTRERLVLVPPSCVTEEYESQAGPRLGITGGVARDATPDDLERAGWVPSVGDGSFAAVCDVIQRAHRVMHTEPGSDLVRECARVWREGREAVERAEKAERERDEARRLHSEAAADYDRIADKARRVLAGSGPDPMPVVRAAMRYLDHGDDGRLGSAWVKFREAVDAYRKAGGTP